MKTTLAMIALGLAVITTTGLASSPAFARKGADDAAGHVRQGRGTDDTPGHIRGGHGADDPAGDDRGGKRGGKRKGGSDHGPNHA